MFMVEFFGPYRVMLMKTLNGTLVYFCRKIEGKYKCEGRNR